MALDLTGIQNVEFYSGHYLQAVLEGDLKSVLDSWTAREKADGTRPPHKRLAALASRFFDALATAGEHAGTSDSDLAARFAAARGFHAHLVEALGFPYSPSLQPLDQEQSLPVVTALDRDGQPFLWIVDTPFPARTPSDEDPDPLAATPHADQLPPDSTGAQIPSDTSWRQLLDERVFRLDPAPRFVLVLTGTLAFLAERSKWPQGRYLRFDLAELFRRKESKALRATAGLLHRDVLAPDSGLCLHDTLDENSHKHAFAVSGDLKHGVRRAIELLGNEAIFDRRERQHAPLYQPGQADLAAQLTEDCLTFVYRLLFLFYVLSVTHIPRWITRIESGRRASTQADCGSFSMHVRCCAYGASIAESDPRMATRHGDDDRRQCLGGRDGTSCADGAAPSSVGSLHLSLEHLPHLGDVG